MKAFPQLAFNQPVGIVNAGDNSNRLFVVEQPGAIRVFNNSASATSASVFLDLTDRVLFGGEQGLLGLAFHPNFAANGYFYVDYVAANPTRTVIARYSVLSSTPNQADKASELPLLTISQPYSNHKGGQIAFGPDGYLYIGLGDGGNEGDPLNNGQNRSTLLGKILRIDVNNPSGGRNFGIPADNPYVGNTLGYQEEIYAYGFRNPWRFSFDSATSKLWVGDVGQDTLEKIDVVENGKNYGWSIMEGTQTYKPGDQTGMVLPVYEYNHAVGNAIIGGYVYHGAAIPALQGFYIYGDYGTGKIWALQPNITTAQNNQLLTQSGLTLSSFGTDQEGELYLCALSDGEIYKLANGTIPEFPTAFSFAIATAITVFVAFVIKKQTPHLKPHIN